MDQEAKRKWINTTLQEIRNKNLQNPVKLNPATVIPDLESYLKAIEAAVLHYNNKKVLRVFIHKLNQLKEL